MVNFRVDPDIIQRHLPPPLRPKLHNGYAVAGICLIRLEQMRPRHIPRIFGFESENAAHRIAVEWKDVEGIHTGVYINRRDTSSLLNRVAGGRLFPGDYHQADFRVVDDGQRVTLRMASSDGVTRVEIEGGPADEFPDASIFQSLAEASAFFESGSLGYSVTHGGTYLDGMSLQTDSWSIAPFKVDWVRSSFFDNCAHFPEGSVEFDCALVMRNVAHVWRSAPALHLGPALHKC